MSTITTCNMHNIQCGDIIQIIIPDRRWWRRAWFAITFRRNPMRIFKSRVGRLISLTPFEIEDLSLP